MRRKILSIWSILLVLIISLAVLVPGCEEVGTIYIHAILDGSPWEGSLEYELSGLGRPVTGSFVDSHHAADAGNWTCAYVSGGPVGANFIMITPSASRELSAGGTISFTLNFATPPPPPSPPSPAGNVSLVFKTWTINGIPIDPAQSPFPVGPGDWISGEFEEYVSGDQEGELVTVHQMSGILCINLGGNLSEDSIWFQVGNSSDSVTMDPSAEGKANQQTMVERNPLYPGQQVQLAYDDTGAFEVEFGVEVDWELRTCINYTKTINFIGFGEAGSMALLDTTEIDPFDAITMNCFACVHVEGDENHENFYNCLNDLSPILVIYYSP